MTKRELTAEQRERFSRIGRSNVACSKAHERRVAGLLTAWAGVPFRRRRVEGRDDAVRVVEMVADVIPCSGEFNFVIECKKEKGFSLDALLANPATSLFTSWWHQCSYDAQLLSNDFGRPIYPLLFFKPHPNWDWVAFSARALPTLGSVLAFPHLCFSAFETMCPVSGNVSHSKKNKRIMSICLDGVIMCRWRDFEDNIDPRLTFLTWPGVEIGDLKIQGEGGPSCPVIAPPPPDQSRLP